MKNNSLLKLGTFGQSLWLDDMWRDWLTSGELRSMIEEDGLRGMTSNPAIFEEAIASGHDYDEDIRAMALEGKGAQAIYDALSQRDVQDIAEAFRPLNEKTDGNDGFVSLALNPHLAHDTQGTMQEARRLWAALNRPNIFISVPATDEGIPAIQQLISEGINVNVTLLFGLPRYRQVAEAYLAGIEARLAQGKSIGHVASVASFFVSRIDALVDPLLEGITKEDVAESEGARQVRGQVAVASAKAAYQIYKEIFSSERFKKLAERDARVQRLLWSSTRIRNPEYRDILYIEELIGPDTINTATAETIEAYRDHGNPETRLDQDLEKAYWVLEQLPILGINIDEVARQLENEGVEESSELFERLMETLAQKSLKYLTRQPCK